MLVQQRRFRWLAPRDVFRGVAGIDNFVERVPLAAVLQSRPAVHANVIALAVIIAAIELDPAEKRPLGVFRAPESEERFCVTVGNLIWPVAAVTFRVEGQPLGTIENVTPAVGAVHELATTLGISDLEVTVLVRAVVGWLGRLSIRPAIAVDIYWVSTRVIESGLWIKKKPFRAELLLSDAIDALYISVALRGDWKPTILLRTGP